MAAVRAGTDPDLFQRKVVNSLWPGARRGTPNGWKWGWPCAWRTGKGACFCHGPMN